jgi:hypothetical protein
VQLGFGGNAAHPAVSRTDHVGRYVSFDPETNALEVRQFEGQSPTLAHRFGLSARSQPA